MARPKTATETPKLSVVLREVVQNVGMDASLEDARSYIAKTYPTLQYNAGSLNSGLSATRKKARDGGTTAVAAAPVRRGRKPAKPATTSTAAAPAPTATQVIAAMKQINDLVSQVGKGTVQELLGTL